MIFVANSWTEESNEEHRFQIPRPVLLQSGKKETLANLSLGQFRNWISIVSTTYAIFGVPLGSKIYFRLSYSGKITNKQKFSGIILEETL